MMHFGFLAKIVSFQKVAQNLSTQQHTMSQFSSLKENGVTCRGIEWSLRAFESVPALRFLLRARAMIDISRNRGH